MSKVNCKAVLFENGENIQFPKAGIERSLKFIDELPIAIFKATCPFVQHIPIIAVLLGADGPKIWVL